MLNEAQQRSVRVVMQLLEEKMKDVELLLEQGEPQGVTFQLIQDLTPEIITTLHETIPAVYALVKEIHERFSLPVQMKSARREALKGLPQLWVMLEESESRNLRRYGEVDPRVGPLLDPAVQKLGKLILQLQHLLLPNDGPVQHAAAEIRHETESPRER